MKKLLSVLFATAATLASAHAEEVYLGASIWHAKVNMDVATTAAKTSFSDSVREGKLFGGVQLDKTWGLEGGYIHFGDVATQYTLASVPGNFKTDGHAWYAAGSGRYAFNDQWSVFGKLGLARTDVSFSIDGAVTATDKATKTGAYLGTGIQFQLTKQAALIVELERYGKTAVQATRASVDNTNTVSIGARFSF